MCANIWRILAIFLPKFESCESGDFGSEFINRLLSSIFIHIFPLILVGPILKSGPTLAKEQNQFCHIAIHNIFPVKLTMTRYFSMTTPISISSTNAWFILLFFIHLFAHLFIYLFAFKSCLTPGGRLDKASSFLSNIFWSGLSLPPS